VSGDDYVEIVSRMRLPDADRQWKAWLEVHGLEVSDFHGDEVAQDVLRGSTGKSFSIFRVRRSALQRLLPKERL
jgi:hypothetical protein